MRIIKLLIILFVLVFSFSSCEQVHAEGDGHNQSTAESDQHTEDDGHNHGATVPSAADDAHVEGEIHLTREQIKTVGLTFGNFTQVKINDFISATGTLGLPPNAYSSVSAKANGFIKDSNKYVEGSYVKKGVVMAYLENPEFIQYQREYLEVAAELTFLKQELERQEKLMEAKAGVISNLQKLQSEVNIKRATLKGIDRQLAYLGINVANLSPDNIVERIAIISPMSGYITSIKSHNGMYVTPEMELMEIVSENHLHLELDIFEKDIANIKEEQKISYTVPALGNTVYEGDVHVIGKEFDRVNKTVRIHGHLHEKRPQFIKDLFVEAKIWLNDQTVQALPDEAIIKDGASSYIYVANDGIAGEEVAFEKVMVIPGTMDKGYTSVKVVNPISEGMKIVTEGAYFVYAQSKAGELKHEH
jgi:cobalt-zinc-cadmium efflux system membrane fusion protein